MGNDGALLALRLGVGVIFLVHGIQKWAMWKMQPSAQLPAGLLSLLGFLPMFVPLGGLGVVVGFLPQAAAVGPGPLLFRGLRLKALPVPRGFTGDRRWGV